MMTVFTYDIVLRPTYHNSNLPQTGWSVKSNSANFSKFLENLRNYLRIAVSGPESKT